MSTRPVPASGEQDAPCDSGVLELLPDPAAVRRARTFVQDRCRAAGVEAEDCDVVVLVTSELVTNAFLHGRSPTRLNTTINRIATLDNATSTHLSADPNNGRTALAVRVEVTDDNSRHPVAAQADPDAHDGRGLAVVDLLATTWGVRDEPVGKTVWFELCTRRRSA